jgi:single-strand DNA-binding protein
MFSSNLVVLRGRLSSDPTVRQLPSGTTVTQIELTTSCDGAAISVPVVVESREVTARAGAEVVVIGHVRRRFFRAGGVTQSRTEVAATVAVPTRRATAAGKALQAAEAVIAGRL